MQFILQLTKPKEFREVKNSLIRHAILPQPLIHHIVKPFSRDSISELNMPKYELEGANAARLLALNNADKNQATFLSASEKVGLDENQPCADPIKTNFTFNVFHRLQNGPTTSQTAKVPSAQVPHLAKQGQKPWGSSEFEDAWGVRRCSPRGLLPLQ